MTEKFQVYKCAVCGNVVEVLHAGAGQLVCCGQPMQLLEEKNKEEGNEKHMPVIETNEEGVIVKVGSVPHPMEETHYIEWIEIFTEKGRSKKFLSPGEPPEAKFPIKSKQISARAFCNVHGLWRSS